VRILNALAAASTLIFGIAEAIFANCLWVAGIYVAFREPQPWIGLSMAGIGLLLSNQLRAERWQRL